MSLLLQMMCRLKIKKLENHESAAGEAVRR